MSVGDVVEVLQSAAMVTRIADEVAGYLVELGDDGRLVRLQLAELTDGVDATLRLVVRDYLHVAAARRPGVDVDKVAAATPLTSAELRDARKVADVLHLPASSTGPDSGIEPRATGC